MNVKTKIQKFSVVAVAAVIVTSTVVARLSSASDEISLQPEPPVEMTKLKDKLHVLQVSLQEKLMARDLDPAHCEPAAVEVHAQIDDAEAAFAEALKAPGMSTLFSYELEEIEASLFDITPLSIAHYSMDRLCELAPLLMTPGAIKTRAEYNEKLRELVQMAGIIGSVQVAAKKAEKTVAEIEKKISPVSSK